MKTRFVHRLIPLIAVFLIAVVDECEAAGKNCLFIGHSFFTPVALRFGSMPSRAWISNHRQSTVYARGASGSPESLWNGIKGNAIRRTLSSGRIDLLGMTYYNQQNSSFEDYQRWVEFAIQHNPNTTFFIGLPWGRASGKQGSPEMFAANSSGAAALFSTVSRLRSAYPGSRFIFLNYGVAAAELNRLYESGKLPGVKKLIGKTGEAVYADRTGHGANMLKDLCALVWLRSIYGVSPSRSGLSFGYQTDIRQIASRL